MKQSSRWFTILITLAAAVGLAGNTVQEANLSGLPATMRLQEYIQAFNSGSPEEMRKFLQSHYAESALRETPVEERVGRYAAVKSRLQSILLEKIAAEQPLRTFALALAGNGEKFLLRVTVEKNPPHKLRSLFFEPLQDPNDLVIPDPKADEKQLLAAVRDYLQGQAGADQFSGVALIAQDARVLFHQAFGQADREKKIPNRKDTKFNLGSINKNFTRVAIYQLENQGKLSLDDPIKKFLPDYPNRQAAEKVTIRQLLQMTSGIGDFFGRRYEATPKDKIKTLQDYLPLFADLPLEFEPGTSNRYSNGGYIILGIIIEKVVGTDYYTYVRHNIFQPHGMSDTDSYPRDAGTPNLAKGYTREGRSEGAPVLNLASLPGRGSSAGGGYSTADNLLKYVLALKAGKIFLPDIVQGLGIAGGAPGINSAIEWDPGSGYIVIVLSNFDPPTAGKAAKRILSWLPDTAQ